MKLKEILKFNRPEQVSDCCYKRCGHSFAGYFEHHLKTDYFYNDYVRSLIPKQHYCSICGQEATESDRENMKLYVERQIKKQPREIRQIKEK
jgi:hypothetical protein